VRWTFTDARFTDGGTITGSFVYDADTQQVPEWSVSVAGGETSAFPPLTYTELNGSADSGKNPGNSQPTVYFYLGGSQRVLRVTPMDALTNAGGDTAINLNTAGNRSGGVECYNCGPWREISAGSLHGVPVPGGFAIRRGVTGNWNNAQQDGQGFQFEVLPGGTMTAFWFVFDNAGNQAWIAGAGQINGDTVTMNAARVLAGRFPPNYNPATVERRPWGTLVFKFSDCNNGTVTWTSTDESFTATGSYAITRLTSIDGLTCP
jgi:hypothetical protein